MEVSVFNMQGEQIRTITLSEHIYEAPIKVDLMHQAYLRQIANARLGTHKTKPRSEVRGGGRKPWRQKGTGRARQGSIRAAQWVGGGKIHTPQPRDYTQKMPQKMRRAALRSALSVKASNEGIVVVEGLSFEKPSARAMANVLKHLIGDSTALVLIPEKSPEFVSVAKSTSNLANAKPLHASYLNIRDLLGYDKIVIPVEALDIINAYLG
ncbi:MAG TPA: 50S ribosomal protein L4 [Anaerolineales bacterium]|nr:50S ribosomal protein L4 [Anaerolineales bacterium]